MSNVYHPARYLAAVIAEFKEDCEELTGFELKQRLWKAAVVVIESTDNPASYLDQLEILACDAGLRLSAILATFRSAERRVNR
jgi:hypothetical protein